MQIHDGHRQRMYEKMKQNALAEHEWLEVLLYGMQPRRNTNEVAHRLLRRFGTVEDVLEASLEELQTVDGVGIKIASHFLLIKLNSDNTLWLTHKNNIIYNCNICFFMLYLYGEIF